MGVEQFVFVRAAGGKGRGEERVKNHLRLEDVGEEDIMDCECEHQTGDSEDCT
jgi:hypothetical protein